MRFSDDPHKRLMSAAMSHWFAARFPSPNKKPRRQKQAGLKENRFA